MKNSVISLSNIYKTYKRKKSTPGFFGSVKDLIKNNYHYIKALNGISFNVNEGDIVGYIGKNGAGKSTTIKITLGIIRKDLGSLKIFGKEIKNFPRNLYYDIGAIFGQRNQLWWDISLQNSLLLIKEIYKITNKDYDKFLSIIDEFLSIKELLPAAIRELSLGQRTKCEFVAVFMHNPKIIFLDESTIGIDIVSKEKIRRMITYFNKSFKTTFLLASHELFDIERLCNKIIVLDKGKIIFNGKIGKLRDSFSSKYKKIVLKLSKPLDTNINIFKPNEFDLDINILNDFEIECTFDKNKINTKEFINHMTSDIGIHDILIKEESIEEIVGNIYKENNNEI